MKNEKKITLRETMYLTCRALGVWWSISPQLLILKAGSALFEAASPYAALWFSARLLDGIAAGRDPQTLIYLASAATLSAAILGTLSAILKRCYEAADHMAPMKKLLLYTKKLQEMDFSRLDDPETFALYSNIKQIEQFNSNGLPMVLFQYERLLPALVQILGAAALSLPLFLAPAGDSLAWLNHPAVPLTVIALLFLTAILSPALTNRGYSYWAKYDEEGKLGNRISEFFGYVAFNHHSRALDIRTYRQDLFFAGKRMENHLFGENSRIAGWARGPMGSYMAAGGALSRSFTGAAYLYVCLKAWSGAFGVGYVAQYVGAMTSLVGGLSVLLESTGFLQANVPYLRSVFRFLDMPDEMYKGSLTVEKRSDREYEVEFRHVGFRYPGNDTWVLRDVNLKFQIGERLAVVGPNGSGKTTLIKLLCRLYDPTEGEILLNGINIQKYKYEEYLDIFSVVFQDFQLLAMPFGQNVAGRVSYDAGRVRDALERAGLKERLSSLSKGLDTCIYREFDKEGVEISGGEAQKIAIARALYKDAPFIILDEPTAALDPIAEAEVYAGFDTLISDRTAIYISHRLSSCKFCDRIAVFDQGSIVQSGTHDELVGDTHGKYYKLWQAQAQYYT